MKKMLKLVLIIALVLLLPGCWGYREVDEVAYIITLGLDKGEGNLLNLTAQVAVPQVIGGNAEGGSRGEGQPSEIISVEAATILGGLQMLSTSLSRRPSLQHTRSIVFSEELAREGIGHLLAPIVRFREFRRNTFVAISRGNAREFLEKGQPVLETNPAKFAELLVATTRYTGFSPESQLHLFYNAAKSEAEQPVAMLVAVGGDGIKENGREGRKHSEGVFLAGAVPREGGNEIEIMGAAVFRGGRMVGTLTGDETIIYNMVRGKFKQGIFSFPDPNEPSRFIILNLLAERPTNINVSLKEQGPVIDVNISLEAEFISIQSNIHYDTSERYAEAEQVISRMLKLHADRLVRKTQKDFESDIFGFGKQARLNFLTWQQWEEYNWLDMYPGAQVNVHFDIDIRRIGLLREMEPAREN